MAFVHPYRTKSIRSIYPSKEEQSHLREDHQDNKNVVEHRQSDVSTLV